MKIKRLSLVILSIISASLIFSACSSGQSDDETGTDNAAAQTASAGSQDSSSDNESNSSDSQSDSAQEENSSTSEESGSRSNKPVVNEAVASGDVLFTSDYSNIDASNTSDGYIMANYTGTVDKIKIQITTPDQTVYTYLLNNQGDYEAFPLSGGDGTYTVGVYENIEGDMYAELQLETIDVELSSDYIPFLYPNQYVSYTKDSKIIAKAKKLAKGANDDLDVVENVYNYIVENISYDYDKAKTVTYGYVPDVDQVLKSKKGICFDYASLIAAMLRTQGIPTKLVIGYADDVYHAWISIYTEETGWIENVIEFNGDSWKMLDPTYASTADDKEYSPDTSDITYTVKYTY